MDTLFRWIHQIYTMLSLVPFVAFFITWFIVFMISRNKRQATYMSMDITTLFLIGSVAYMSRNLFGSAMLLWTIVLLFLVAAGLLGNVQNRMKGRIDLVKIARMLSRVGFLALTACYVVLLILGIGKYMLSH
ncbi:DUF3397 domain-containing protein [Paenibacillus cremeus]|uniref:DUF3397 domain-containing protein n=1 Tax=Paenibacillus cremeus TaxID=2163881 RepID=A0A559KBV2_9BACL|nr:DUF3397 domain-containing protein [Paenibacillus cremeus]TVY09614.1 DUF3397 domain-containing protein [Paenibacillus cremeus]